MARNTSPLMEWLRPGAVRRASIPPLEAGLRPNSRLDDSPILLNDGATPQDVAFLHGVLYVSEGTRVARVADGRAEPLADLGGAVGALRIVGDDLIVAVAGRGLARVTSTGQVLDECNHDLIRQCVTDFAVLPDGTCIVAVGSTDVAADQWSHELVAGRRSGRLVAVRASEAQVLDDRLGWPAGVASDGTGGFLVSLAMDHRVERRQLRSPGTGTALTANMAGYPGRIRERTTGGWWIAMPYLRNRATELILADDAIRADMAANVDPTLWLVPMLRSENVYRDPLQIGQQRVMGVLKPWAPPRAYGLALRLDPDGRIIESAHSRPDGSRKGVTGVAVRDGGVVVACQGARMLVDVTEAHP